MAAVIGVGKELIRKVWKEADLKRNLLERYLAINDPAFEQKAATIIGLYLNPPQQAAVFCVDERALFRRWIGWTAVSRFPPAAPGATALSITGTARFPCSRRSILGPAM